MSELQSENLDHKRVLIARLALIASADERHKAYVEDISFSGVQLRNAAPEIPFEGRFAFGAEVAMEIEGLSSLTGTIVRIAEPMITVVFPERSECENKMLIAEIMDRQGWFSLGGPDASELVIQYSEIMADGVSA